MPCIQHDNRGGIAARLELLLLTMPPISERCARVDRQLVYHGRARRGRVNAEKSRSENHRQMRMAVDVHVSVYNSRHVRKPDRLYSLLASSTAAMCRVNAVISPMGTLLVL